MKLSEAVKQYEECMGKDNERGCLVKDCPLNSRMRLTIGDSYDVTGGFIWTIGGCTVMSLFEDWLKNKKPGRPYEDAGG